jgi:PII-like signaling protein
MKLSEDAMLLRVFIGETDKYQGRSLYEQIVLKARELNLAGATVLRGILGFGAHSRLHSAKLLDLSEDLPVVVEIVDIEENINKLLPFIDQAVTEGLVTLEKARVIKYRAKEQKNEP